MADRKVPDAPRNLRFETIGKQRARLRVLREGFSHELERTADRGHMIGEGKLDCRKRVPTSEGPWNISAKTLSAGNAPRIGPHHPLQDSGVMPSPRRPIISVSSCSGDTPCLWRMTQGTRPSLVPAMYQSPATGLAQTCHVELSTGGNRHRGAICTDSAIAQPWQGLPTSADLSDNHCAVLVEPLPSTVIVIRNLNLRLSSSPERALESQSDSDQSGLP
ncbi:hypothetical protein LY76DRAFT_212680 [Colletotrichum caudatum]|nr:hypothetical protein LY76DRAFT_212680 [Colletotrichum caudatum]